MDRFAQRLKDLGVGVLGRKLHQLIEAIDELQCVTADKVQLAPKSIEFFGLLLVKHESAEMVIFAIEQRQRDDFIHRDNPRIAQCRGKEVSIRFKSLFDTTAGRAPFTDENRSRILQATIVVRPGAIRVCLGHGTGD